VFVVLDSLVLGDAREQFVPATVTGSLSENFEGLLGMDFITTFKLRIDAARASLAIQGCRKPHEKAARKSTLDGWGSTEKAFVPTSPDMALVPTLLQNAWLIWCRPPRLIFQATWCLHDIQALTLPSLPAGVRAIWQTRAIGKCPAGLSHPSSSFRWPWLGLVGCGRGGENLH
jgi:hypothetical protein